ncbi:Tyrosine-type recombinase/integrase [Sulfidibacter corallicola]|uniref:Tyrosine-type recombinase/integrase n=1 Tax=Sulfidibacter corallicola TaxID=2818388 RepID=A0A8A4TXG9_SULCO|nr:tyrosine-type recombinase/integrase [Sulfidibacter corallicola]QTD54173.1 tyrosine-type recombinase/integrase [Sulfidibacter corallicola]
MAKRNLDGTLEAFTNWLKTDGRAAKTITAYTDDLALLTEAIQITEPDTTLETVTREDLVAALASPKIQNRLDGQPRAPATIKRIKSSALAFFSWAMAAKVRDDNPAKTIRVRHPERKLPVFLNLQEKKRLLKTLRSRATKISIRDRVMIEILLRTGMRVSELIGLNVDDVDLDDKKFRIRAKGGKEHVKFIKSSLRTLLKTYLSRYRPKVDGEPALFLSNRLKRISHRQVETRVKHWVKAAGITKRISPHKLRHTFATHLLQQGGNLKLVQRALGHTNITSTAIYAHVVDDDLAEAIENL